MLGINIFFGITVKPPTHQNTSRYGEHFNAKESDFFSIYFPTKTISDMCGKQRTEWKCLTSSSKI